MVISLDTAKRQAKEYGRTLEAEVSRYLAHGLLHLLGHDHERPTRRGRWRPWRRSCSGRAAWWRTRSGRGVPGGSSDSRTILFVVSRGVRDR